MWLDKKGKTGEDSMPLYFDNGLKSLILQGPIIWDNFFAVLDILVLKPACPDLKEAENISRYCNRVQVSQEQVAVRNQVHIDNFGSSVKLVLISNHQPKTEVKACFVFNT